MDRRRFLLTSGAVISSIGFSGCNGSVTGSNSTPAVTDTETRSLTPSPTRSPTSTPEPFPIHLNGVGASTWPDPSNNKMYQREFKQSVQGKETVFQTEIPGVLYDYYKARIRSSAYGSYVSDRYDDFYIKHLASQLQQFGNQYDLSKSEVVNHAIALTQGMKYTKDVNKPFNEYPRFPVETLVEKGGDCEDTSILLAALLEKLGFGCVILLLPEAKHAAVGILGDESIEGSYYEYEGGRYYYVETTGSGWRVGEVPEHVKNSGNKAKIREINSSPVLVFGYRIRVNGPGEVDCKLTVANQGDAAATNISFQIGFEDMNGGVVTRTSTGLPKLDTKEKRETTFSLNTPPDDIPLRIRAGVFLDGKVHDYRVSDYQEPV